MSRDYPVSRSQEGAGAFGPPDRAPEGAVAPFVRALRKHRLLVAGIILLTLAGAIFHRARRSSEYSASAQILVSPLPQDNAAFLGLPLVRDSGDPTRTIETAATLVDSPQAAALTARRLGSGWSVSRVKRTVDVKPQGQSNILDIAATAPNGPLSARLANTFVRSVIDSRRQALQQLVPSLIRATQAQLDGLGSNSGSLASTLSDKIAQLKTIEGGTDPTLAVSELASVPSSANGAPSWLVIGLAGFAGFILAAGAALLLDLASPRTIAAEEDLLAVYPLPVLSRIPALPRRYRRHGRVLVVPPGIREAFRTLQVQLEFHGGAHRSILFTSASTGDGKTTSVVNFGLSLADASQRVILLDLDLRKPDLAAALDVQQTSAASLTDPYAPLVDMLTPIPDHPDVLIAGPQRGVGVNAVEELSRRLPDLLEEARDLADYVVIDTPPLGEVSDALRFIPAVDDVILVSQLGNSREAHLATARDLLGRARREPSGLVVIGSSPMLSAAYHHAYGGDDRQASRSSVS